MLRHSGCAGVTVKCDFVVTNRRNVFSPRTNRLSFAVANQVVTLSRRGQ